MTEITSPGILGEDVSATAPLPMAFALTEQRFHLVCVSGALKGQSFPLSQEAPLALGRGPTNTVVIHDSLVSQEHAAISWDGRGFVLRDLDSMNGTYIDQTRVKEAYLRPGGTLRIGECTFKVHAGMGPLLLEPSGRERFASVVGRSAPMREIFSLLERLAPKEATVLLVGETGTGKGAIARAVHEQSLRAARPFVVVDCAAVAPSLVESEIFGHEKGAFTGAVSKRAGALELAEDGTLFLDEIDDLRSDLQPKLLRALEERVFTRLGARTTTPMRARVLGATKKDLRAMVSEGKFREDLYFRLAVFQVRLPALRDRKEDIPVLVDRFAQAFGREHAWDSLSDDVRALLQGHRWPGNVRELRNAVERAFTLVEGESPGPAAWELDSSSTGERGGLHADMDQPFRVAKDRLVDTFEKQYLRALLTRVRGNVTRAAREADMDRKHLYTLLHKHGLLARDTPEDEG